MPAGTAASISALCAVMTASKTSAHYAQHGENYSTDHAVLGPDWIEPNRISAMERVGIARGRH